MRDLYLSIHYPVGGDGPEQKQALATLFASPICILAETQVLKASTAFSPEM